MNTYDVLEESQHKEPGACVPVVYKQRMSFFGAICSMTSILYFVSQGRHIRTCT